MSATVNAEVSPEGSADPDEHAGQPEFHLNLLGVVQGLLTILVVAVFVLTFLAQPFRIPSESMEPTLRIGDFLLVDKSALAPAGAWSWLLPYRGVQRGDVVVFRRGAGAERQAASDSPGDSDGSSEGIPQREGNYLIKRIVAVPGDRLRLNDGRVSLNGAVQPEPYAMFLPSGPDAFRDDFPAAQYIDAGVDGAWWIAMHRLVQNGQLRVPEGHYFAMGDNRNHSLDSRYWGFVERQQIAGVAKLVYFSVRTDSPDELELRQYDAAEAAKNAPPNDRMSKQSGWAWLDFARWDRVLRVVR